MKIPDFKFTVDISWLIRKILARRHNDGIS
jgi:hypothetical protein